ncbi:hypothetical protein [Streptomyces sp. NPDC048603]|uniref:hypothetical protein n=1 Tax=Streptomyces sp. NPDC048603 TaxID=3365577 RepID=UPI00370FC402
MIWWARSRALALLTAVTLLTVLAGIAVGDTQLPLPAFRSGTGVFVLAGMSTVVPAVLWVAMTGRIGPVTEATAVRPVHRYDALAAAGPAAFALALGVAGHEAGAGAAGIALATGRNTALYFGLALLLVPLVGHRAAAPLTVAFPMVCGAAGSTAGGADPWALVLWPGTHAGAFAAAVGLTAAGCALGLLRPPRTPGH